MGNLFSNKQGPKVFSAEDVLEQAEGTYGETLDIPVVPSKTKRKELLKKANFKAIDRAALDAPPELLLENFWDISDHLVVSKSFDVIDDIYRIRAIFRWMTSFDEESIMTQILPPENSPLEYLIKIQSDFGDHAHLLYVLCVSANIPCVVINGVSKHGFYEVGDEIQRDVLGSKWNAVLINGEWRLIDPFWAHTSIPYGQYRDQISVDENGKILLSNDLGDNVGDDRPVNDFFFLCDPEKFIWTHLPDEEQWQLLETPISAERFQEQPYLREHFHEFGLSITDGFKDANNCVLKPDGRPCKLSFDLPPERSDNYEFKFTLTEIDVHIEDERESAELEKYVMMSKSKVSLQFGISFPFIGRFRLDIYALDKTAENQFKLICAYAINCGTACKNFKGFPDVPEHGWGPHPLAEKLGLVPITPKSSVIKTETGIVEVRIPAKITREISHGLTSTHFDEATLSRHAIGRLDRDEYIVNMRLPEAGDYTLKIFADVDELRGKMKDSTVITFLIEFTGNATNEPYPFVLGSQIGSKMGAFQLDIEALDDPNSVLMAWNGKLELKFTANKDAALFSELSSSNKSARKLMSIRDIHENGHWTFKLTLPVAGIYSLNLFAWNEKEKQKKVEEAFSFLIQSTGSLSKEEMAALDKKSKSKRTERSSADRNDRTCVNGMERSNTFVDSESQIAKSRMESDDFLIDVVANNNKTDAEIGTIAEGDGSNYIKTSNSTGSKTCRFEVLANRGGNTNRPPVDTSFSRQTSNKEKTMIGNEHKIASSNGGVTTPVQKKTENVMQKKGALKKQKTTPREGAQKESTVKRKAVTIVENRDKDKIKKSKKGDIDVKTFITHGNIVKINIDHPIKTVFTSMRRTDANDKPKDKAVVVKQNDCLEVRISGYGQYQIDVMSKETGPHVKVLGSYTVIRRPSGNPNLDTSIPALKLFEGNNFDGNVFMESDDEFVFEEERKDTNTHQKKSPKNSKKIDFGTIEPDLRSIKSNDLLNDLLQERFTDATNREMKAKLRRALKVKDLELLLKYLELYQKTTETKRDFIFPKSVKNMFQRIKEQQRLVEECKMETPVLMDESIQIIKGRDDKNQQEIRIMVAHKIVDKNTRKEKVTKVRLEINQIALTEIKQYSHPPEGVHECIAATLALLGDNIDDLKDFSACQGLLFRTGRLYIMRRIIRFNSRIVPKERADFVSKLLRDYTMWQILDVSRGAAAFYMWVKAMLYEIRQRNLPPTRSTTAKSTRSTRRVPPRPTALPEYISRRDGTIILKL